jgi:hypothetical protein
MKVARRAIHRIAHKATSAPVLRAFPSLRPGVIFSPLCFILAQEPVLRAPSDAIPSALYLLPLVPILFSPPLAAPRRPSPIAPPHHRPIRPSRPPFPSALPSPSSSLSRPLRSPIYISISLSTFISFSRTHVRTSTRESTYRAPRPYN